MSSIAGVPNLRGSSISPRRAFSSSGTQAVNWPLITRFLALIVLTCVCYWPALNGEFQWDDGVLVRDNEMLRSLAGLRDIWASTKPYDYFPLTYTTFWLEWPLWGSDPTGYHLVNLGFHLAGACLLWRLLLAMRVPGAWFGALLFAIHPVNVASVAWIAERKNTVSMVFYLACLLKFLESENAVDDKCRKRCYRWALGFFALAALSKSSVVMLPFVLLLLCWWRTGKVRWLELTRSVPFFAVSLASGIATMWFQYHRAMDPGFHDEGKLPFLVRLTMSGHSAWFYLEKALLPVRLGMLYPRWTLRASSVGDFLPLIGCVFLLVVALAGRARWGRNPFTVLAYFFLTLMPVAGLLHMSYYTYSYVSDHLVHLSLIGIIVGISAGLGTWRLRAGASSWVPSAVMIALAGCYMAATFQRADQFSTPRRLWESTREVDPQSFAVYNNLGADAQGHGRISEAESYFSEALRLEPRSFSAGNSLANILRMQGKWRESAALYQAILSLQPDAQCHNNLGVVLLELGDTSHAREQFQRAVALEPAMVSAHFNLYRTEQSEHHLTAAADALRQCLRLNPADSQAMTALASLSLEQATAQSGTKETNSTVFDPTVVLAERACQLTHYGNPQSLAVLSKALYASGRRAEAIAMGRRTLAQAAEKHQRAFANEFSVFATSMAKMP